MASVPLRRESSTVGDGGWAIKPPAAKRVEAANTRHILIRNIPAITVQVCMWNEECAKVLIAERSIPKNGGCEEARHPPVCIRGPTLATIRQGGAPGVFRTGSGP